MVLKKRMRLVVILAVCLLAVILAVGYRSRFRTHRAFVASLPYWYPIDAVLRDPIMAQDAAQKLAIDHEFRSVDLTLAFPRHPTPEHYSGNTVFATDYWAVGHPKDPHKPKETYWLTVEYAPGNFGYEYARRQ